MDKAREASETTETTTHKQPQDQSQKKLARRIVHPLDWSGVIAEQGYVLGVDISGGGERAVLADLHGRVVSRHVYQRPHEGPQQPGEVLDRVEGMMRGLLDGKGAKSREVLRVGVGFGGPVDARRGMVRLSHDSPGWEGFPLASRLEEAFDVPTLIDNDARLAALGEVWFGAGHADPECNLVYVHWSTGVGGGIVSDGKLVHGATTTAGEVGHTVVRTSGEALPCRCGGKGHLEAYVRSSALVERALKLYDGAWDSREPLSMSAVFDGAERDPRLRELVDEAVDMMAFTIGNLITAVNPNVVAIGGRVARHATRYIPLIANQARAYAMPLAAQNVEIAPAALGEDSGVMGAVALGLESLR